jgi:PIN domain nuclease of toxin-antitoxin system
MIRPILLDTCALLWLGNGDKLAGEADHALAEAEIEAEAIMVSPISAWEIGQLAARGRLILPMDPLAWFEAVLDSGVALAPMPPNILVGSSFLPGTRLSDPADRIIAATARSLGCRLMTRDRELLRLAREGHLQAIAC